MPLHIDEIFAFVSEDEHGNEGVCGFRTNDGTFLPMVCADKARVDSLREMADLIKRTSGMQIKLLRFSKRSLIEVL